MKSYNSKKLYHTSTDKLIFSSLKMRLFLVKQPGKWRVENVATKKTLLGNKRKQSNCEISRNFQVEIYRLSEICATVNFTGYEKAREAFRARRICQTLHILFVYTMHGPRVCRTEMRTTVETKETNVNPTCVVERSNRVAANSISSFLCSLCPFFVICTSLLAIV